MGGFASNILLEGAEMGGGRDGGVREIRGRYGEVKKGRSGREECT